MIPSGHLHEHARRRPHALACADGARALTFRTLARVVGAWVEVLERAGAGPGERVALFLGNGAQLVAAYLAARSLGAPVVAGNPRAPLARRRALVDDAAPRALVCTRRGWEELRGALPGAAAEQAPAGLGPAAWVARLPAAAPHPQPPDLAALIYTSGSTGPPKGVMLSAPNMAAIAEAGCAFVGLGPEDRVGVASPLFHLYGLRDVDACLRAGAAMVLLGEAAYPARVLGRMAEAGVTGLSTVPSGMAMVQTRYAPLLAACRTRLRYLAMGAAVATPELLAGLARALPETRLLVTYGLTEASRVCYREVREPRPEQGSVGTPYPGVRVWVTDETGAPVPDGTCGRVRVQSAMVMAGYWRRPEHTARALAEDGTLVTPDRGRMDANGALHLMGRVDDVINSGGEKIAPEQVEAVLREDPDIADAAVVGVADPNGILGQVVKACVVPRAGAAPDLDALRRRCARHLEPHQVPAVWELHRALPRSEIGKIDRARLARERPAPRGS